MKRKDMLPGVLYAIERTHHNPRPGFVTDPGTPPGKVAARVYWSWPGDNNWLETDHDVICAGKYDECEVGTGDVLGTWADYVAERTAARDARLAEMAAEKAAKEAKRAANVARVDAVLPRLAGMQYAPGELAWAARSDNMHDRRWNAADVLALIEHLIGQEGNR